MASPRQDSRILYRLIGLGARIMAGFCAMIVAVVIWRKQTMEGVSETLYERGEVITLAVLAAVILGCLGLDILIKRELRKNS